MMVRVSRPIRSRKAHQKRKEDPIVKSLTRAVGLICLGFLLILIGVLLTVFGVADYTNENKVSSTIIVGPIILLLGILLCVGGFIYYGVNYKLRMERDVDFVAPQNGADNADQLSSTLGPTGASLRKDDRGSYI